MSEFGGLWKQQNNPACIKNVTVGHYTKEDEEAYLESLKEEDGTAVPLTLTDLQIWR